MDQDMEMPMQAAVGNVISCPDHPNSQLIEDHRSGDCICTECGMVVMERWVSVPPVGPPRSSRFFRAVDERAEWRTFQDESGGRGDGLDRVGAGEEGSYNAGDLSTKIGASDYGEARWVCGAAALGLIFIQLIDTSSRFSNLVQQQQRVTSSHDRVFIQAANTIRETVAKIHIVPAILDKALKVLRQMLNSRKLLGKSMEAKAAGCLYYACRLDKAPRAIRGECRQGGLLWGVTLLSQGWVTFRDQRSDVRARRKDHAVLQDNQGLVRGGRRH
jgi:transcription initiation factor TFIIB